MDAILLDIDPQPYLIRLGFLGVLFGLLAVALVMVLTGRGVRAGMSGRFSTRAALTIVVPLWLVATGWRYYAEFGDRFYQLRTTAPEQYTLVYAYPARTVTLRAAEITAWREAVDWTEKLPGHRVEIDLANGTTHRSSRLYSDDFVALRDRLSKEGITVERAR